MTDLSFGRPLWLLLVPVALVLLPLTWMAVRRSLQRARAFTRSPLTGRWGMLALVAIAAALAALAAAQPRWGERTAVLEAGGAQLVIVLDVSRSMDVADVPPSRLGAARTAMVGALDRLSGDRVGLVIFAGDARVRFPLTTDLAAAAAVIQSVESGTFLVERGTSAGSGLEVALEAFDEDAGGGRLVVLISDGDNLGADPAANAAALAGEGIELLVVGAGTSEGGIVPVFDALSDRVLPLIDANGRPVVSRLNEGVLQTIATAGGGRYLGTDLGSLPAAVRSRLAALDQVAHDSATASVPVERFQWFAGAALALVLLATAAEWRVGLPWRRPAALAVASCLGLLLAACATEAYDLNEQARDAFAGGEAETAIELLFDAQAEAPEDGRIALNLATVLHSAERYDEAVQVARRVLSHRDPEVVVAAHESIARNRFSQGELQEALDAFGEALVLDPGNDRARRDYEVVYRLLHPPEAPPPPPDQAEPPDPGEGDPPPPEGDEGPDTQPGEGPGDAGADPSGDGGDTGSQGRVPIDAVEAQLAEIDEAIEAARRAAGAVVSAQEALEILDLLEERSRIAAQRARGPQGVDADDY